MTDSDEPQYRFRASIARFMATGFLALVVVIASTGVIMRMNQRQSGWIMHTYQVQREIDTIRLDVADLFAVRLSNRLNPDDRMVRNAGKLKLDLARSIGRLSQLTRDNPRQQARIPLLLSGVAHVESQAGLDVPVDESIRAFSDDPGQQIAALCSAMQAEENQILTYRYGRRAMFGNAFFVILSLTAVLLLIVALLAYTTIRSFTREVNASRLALHAANSGLEAAVQERTTELTRANAEIQRFAYIVSHDLRSPLVNIMGFTSEIETATRTLHDEMMLILKDNPQAVSQTSQTVIFDELPEAAEFIRASGQKMDRLIKAILQLSRLGQRTLRPEWIAIDALVTNVIGTLQGLINSAGGKVDIVRPMPDILCDPVALEQILANLIENAIKYRHAERPLIIRVTATRTDNRVVICVTDNGRGIATRDQERVFDLFRRAGAQDQPGEGIGLAHVRALAYRLGGTIGLESTPGIGSNFILSLPVHFSEVSGAPS